MGMPVVTSLSSVGTSRATNLDWMGAKYLSFAVTGSSSGTFAYFIEGTLDDLQQTAAALVTWFTMSSATLTTNSSINLYQGPLGSLRINSSAVANAVLSMRIM